MTRLPSFLVGGTFLMSGMVFTLSFSPLLVGMLTGAFLINSTVKRLQTLAALNITQGLMEKVFMFCLGTMMTPLFMLLKGKIDIYHFFGDRIVFRYVRLSSIISVLTLSHGI